MLRVTNELGAVTFIIVLRCVQSDGYAGERTVGDIPAPEIGQMGLAVAAFSRYAEKAGGPLACGRARFWYNGLPAGQ